MAKSLAYWQSRWDSIEHSPYSDSDHPRVIGLLLEYTEAIGIKDDFLWSGLHGSAFLRLITGHWGRNHVNSVINVISRFFRNYNFNEGSTYGHYYQTIYILGRLKSEITNKELYSFGDLALILEVIKQNTGIDFNVVQPVNQDVLDTEQRNLEKEEMNQVANFLDNTPNANDTPSILPGYNTGPKNTAPLSRDRISVYQLKSLLMKYTSSSCIFGDTPEIKKLKALCHSSIQQGVVSLTAQEVGEAITSAKGFRSKSNRIDFFHNGPQLLATDNTSKTVAEIGSCFSYMGSHQV